MKRIALLIAFVGLLSGRVGFAANLVAAYGFEEGSGTTAADSSGNGLTGAVSSGTWVTGKFGNALRFTGRGNSWVTVPNAPALQLTSGMTISAWVYPTAAMVSEPTIIFKEKPGTLSYALYANGGSQGPNVYLTIGGQYEQTAASADIPVSAWTHLAATYDGATLSLYVNGNPVSTSLSGPIDLGNGPLRIAGNSVWSNEGFQGVIDEVRVYDGALSGAEIQYDMVTPIAVNPPPVDVTPPVGTIQINGGAVYASSPIVTLSLAAVDASGVTQMRFSNDGVAFSAPTPYATSVPWALAAGDGPKVVNVQYEDGAGNWSGSFSDTITLDSTPPALGAPAASLVDRNTATISWSTDEASTSLVEYGLTTGYGQSTPLNGSLVVSHNVGLSGLSASTTYHYRVRSIDAAGNEVVSLDGVFTTTDAPPVTEPPSLGAHVLKTQDEQRGSSPAVTDPITTQAVGSVLLALGMGWDSNFAAPTDSYGNAWVSLGGKHLYAGGSFYTAMWGAVNAVGGPNHALSFTKAAHPSGEISMALIEILNGAVIKDFKYAYPSQNQPITAGSVTTDGPATLIAVWGGDGWDLQHLATPSDGFQVIDSYFDLGPTSGVQVAIAVKQVDQAGTYTMSWTSSPSQGAACYLIAVQGGSGVQSARVRR